MFGFSESEIVALWSTNTFCLHHFLFIFYRFTQWLWPLRKQQADIAYDDHLSLLGLLLRYHDRYVDHATTGVHDYQEK